MRYIFHSDIIKNGNNKFIFYKQFKEENGITTKEINYTSACKYEFLYYDNDKTPIVDNEYSHYFIPNTKDSVTRLTRNDYYRNQDRADMNRVYNFYQPDKQFRLEKLKDRVPKTYIYRNINIMYLDIEVFGEDKEVDIFDDTVNVFERYTNPINAITIITQDNLSNTMKEVTLVYDIKKRNNYQAKHEVKYFDSEKELLKEFIKYIGSENPDVYTGWNIFFDLVYIYVRLHKLLGALYCNALSPYFKMFTDEKNIKLHFDTRNMELVKMYQDKVSIENHGVITGWEYKTKLNISGVNVVDYLETCKKKDAVKAENKDSYTLEYFAQEELGEGKVDYSEYATIDELYEQDLGMFIEYNYGDTYLVYKLEQKLGYIKSLCILNGISQIQNIQRSQSPVALWEDVISMYSNKILNKYEIFISKNDRDDIHESFPAALDMRVDELNGLVYRHLMTYDWASLYPTYMLSAGVSPEKKKNIKKGEYKNIRDLIYFVYDYNEKLVSLKDKDALKLSAQTEIARLETELANIEKRKEEKTLQNELKLMKAKLEELDSEKIQNIPNDLIDKIENNFKQHESYVRETEEIDKILLYTKNNVKDFSYGITAFYSQDYEGVVDYIIRDNLELRFMYKKLGGAMSDLLKGGISFDEFNVLVTKIKSQDTEEYKEFLELYKNKAKKSEEIYGFVDDLQNGLKIFLNSGFGVFGNKYFKFYDKDMATSITMGARKVLNELIVMVSNLVNNAFGTKGKRRILYGATDSIFCSFDELFTPEDHMKLTNKQIMERVFAFLKKIDMDGAIKKFVSELQTKIFGTKLNYFALEMEKYSKEGIFFAQKNYILKLIYKGKSYVADNEFGYKYTLKGVTLKKVGTPKFLRTKEKQKEILEMVFKSRSGLNPEILKIDRYIISLFDEYKQQGSINPLLLGGSINLKPDKIKEYLNDDCIEVVKNHCPAQYSGIAIYNNFLLRLEKDGLLTKNFIYKPSGFSEKGVPLFMFYDNEYIKDNISYERKTKTKPAKKKFASMVLPLKFKLSEEIKEQLIKRIDFQMLFEKKVLKTIENYILIPETIDLQKMLRQRNFIKN